MTKRLVLRVGLDRTELHRALRKDIGVSAFTLEKEPGLVLAPCMNGMTPEREERLAAAIEALHESFFDSVKETPAQVKSLRGTIALAVDTLAEFADQLEVHLREAVGSDSAWLNLRKQAPWESSLVFVHDDRCAMRAAEIVNGHLPRVFDLGPLSLHSCS